MYEAAGIAHARKLHHVNIIFTMCWENKRGVTAWGQAENALCHALKSIMPESLAGAADACAPAITSETTHGTAFDDAVSGTFDRAGKLPRLNQSTESASDNSIACMEVRSKCAE